MHATSSPRPPASAGITRSLRPSRLCRLIAAAFLGGSSPALPQALLDEPVRIELGVAGREFDLTDDVDLQALVHATDLLEELADLQVQAFEATQERLRNWMPLQEMTPDELRSFYWEPAGSMITKERRGLKRIEELTKDALQARDATEKAALLRLIREVIVATNNNRRPPVPEQVDFLLVPFLSFDYLHIPVAKGRTPATNLDLKHPTHWDASRADPLPSTFWSRPKSIARQDLYAGFDRGELPDIESPLWEYSAPKTSYGGNPGFEARHGTVEIKVKFGETRSEPLAARLFHALGYHVDPTDYSNFVRFRYDRRYFREFHLRRGVSTEIRAARAIRMYTIDLQRRFDPFDFLQAAVLKDGTRLDTQELRRRLIPVPEGGHPGDDPDAFDERFEALIDHLITVPANIQIKNDDSDSIGPWDYDRLGHENLRELRGVCLLAGWLNWFDSRFDNTRLRVDDTPRGKVIRHYITDLGGCLGRASGALSSSYEDPNAFGWTFTRPARWWTVARGGPSFRFKDYQPIEATLAFKKMTLEDARWMARLIGQLTETQLQAALIGSGFDSAHARLYSEKLVNRRDRMILDLGLESEIPPLRPEGVDREFSYNPRLDGPMRVTRPNGEIVEAPPAGFVIAVGKVEYHAPANPDSRLTAQGRRP